MRGSGEAVARQLQWSPLVEGGRGQFCVARQRLLQPVDFTVVPTLWGMGQRDLVGKAGGWMREWWHRGCVSGGTEECLW